MVSAPRGSPGSSQAMEASEHAIGISNWMLRLGGMTEEHSHEAVPT